MGKKTDGRLDVKAVIDEFQRAEESPVHRKDAFKIDAPFEKALDKILSATNKAKVRPKMEAVNISKTAQEGGGCLVYCCKLTRLAAHGVDSVGSRKRHRK